jgi:hypothetical protein
MDFMFNNRDGVNVWQLSFSNRRGLCLSLFKRYAAIIIAGELVEWAEMTGEKLNLTWSKTLDLEKDQAYHVVCNLTCWDLLELMEHEHITVDCLLDMCYPPPPKNESTEDTTPSTTDS